MSPIYLLIGAPASGKSTLAKALAKRYAKCIHVPVDDLRSMVISGVIHPSATWTPQLVEQLQLARQSALATALNYQRSNFAVILDDFWDPNSQMQEYQSLWKAQNFVPVLLYPKPEQAKVRNQGRYAPGTFRGYIDEGIDIVYKSLQGAVAGLATDGWLVLDTTDDTVDDSVERILASRRQ